MEQLVEFITHHWMLSSALGVVMVAFMANELIQSRLGSSEVSPEAAVQLINHQDAVLFDIRNEAAYAEGHIIGSLSVMESALERKMGSLEKYFSKPVIVVCNSGQTAVKFAALLKQKGFLNVVVLSGGILAWKAAGMPVVKS